MTWVTGRLAGRRVLLAAEPAFAAGYVAQVLAAASAEVRVGLADDDLDLGLDAVVVDLAIDHRHALRLVDAVVEAQLPMLLTVAADAAVPRLFQPHPVLRQPFAGFQVIDRLEALLAPR